MSKCVASRLLTNTDKYVSMLEFMKSKGWSVGSLSPDHFRELHRHLFREATTTRAIEQLRSFQTAHLSEIESHLSSKNELLLLNHHKLEIIKRLKLMEVINLLKLKKKTFRISVLTEISLKSWNKLPNKKDTGMIQKMLQIYFIYKEKGEVMPVPLFCSGYKLVKGQLCKDSTTVDQPIPQDAESDAGSVANIEESNENMENEKDARPKRQRRRLNRLSYDFL
ncbi:hypothetical protein TKK_0017576 [Trichogramma kaykai]|uniref:Uncharacterized protein n=1 Tax=Trichogramma kaykai TaxID=54128 RepID=A0ABD2W2D9_9HYME